MKVLLLMMQRVTFDAVRPGASHFLRKDFSINDDCHNYIVPTTLYYECQNICAN